MVASVKTTKSVMIVEDDMVLREAYYIILKNAGYVTTIASNGQEAIDCLREKVPDIMLLDIYMPVLSGDSMLKIIDKSRYPEMKIIAFSNLSDNSRKQQVLNDGADMFILKSDIGPPDLLEIINNCFESQ